MVGALWALGAAISFSLGHVALAKGIPPLGVARATTVLLSSAMIATAVAALALDGPAVLASAPLTAIAWFAGAGLIHYGGWGFMSASIKRVGPSRMSAITGVTPLFAAVLAVATLHETVNPIVALGIALIVIGTYFIAVS
jgi:drug/metabolite transporter (DMT)-like permease